MKKIILAMIMTVMLALIAPSLSLGVNINEVMYNPVGDDDNKEFVEIFGADNLSGYSIGDSASNDTLTLIKFWPGDIALITEEGFNHSGINASIYSVGATIGNNLNNDKDSIFLFYNKALVDSTIYDGKLANGNGKTLELINGSWQESCEAGGSPGRQNCFIFEEPPINNSINESANITTNETNNETINDTINETINVSTNESATNETINQTSNSSINSSIDNSTIINETIINNTHEINTSLNITLNITDNTTQNTTDNITGNITDNRTNNSSQNSSKNPESLKLEVVLPETVYLGISYDSLFKITNLNYSSGETNLVNVIVRYNTTKDNSLFINSSFTKTVNHYSSADTGSIAFNETGNFTLCGSIHNTTVSACKNILVLDPSAIQCFMEISISTDKEMYDDGEHVEIRYNLKNVINSSSGNIDVPYTITYWVEDLFSEETKDKKNTSNLSPKSFTLDIDEKDQVLLVKNRLSFIGCNNTNPAVESEKMIIVKNPGFQELSCEKLGSGSSSGSKSSKASSVTISKLAKNLSNLTKTIKNETKSSSTGKPESKVPKVISFYTRTKLWKESILVFANIETQKPISILLRSRLEEQKLAISNDSKLNFTVKTEPGTNFLSLELYDGEELIDSKSLVVKLEELKKENTTEILLGSKDTEFTTKKNQPEALEADLDKLTGNIVYQSSSAKMAGYAPYLLAIIILAVIVGLVLLKRR